MEGKASLIGADVKGLTLAPGGCGGIVLPLIQECASLLATQGIVMKLDIIHGEGGLAAVAVEHSRNKLRQLLQFANTLVHAFHNVLRAGKLLHSADYRCLSLRLVPGLGKNLDGIQVVIAVHDQPWKPIGLTEDHAVTI